MIYTNKNDAIEFIGKNEKNYIKEFEFETQTKPEKIYLYKDEHKQYHYFLDLIDAINYADKGDIEKIYECMIDEFNDVNVINLSSIFKDPIYYISKMEFMYRIHNHMNSYEAFQEAFHMWNIFCKEDKKIIDSLIKRYPDYYEKRFENYCLQFDKLQNSTYLNTDDFLNKIYPPIK
jgi:hypothetical protein